MRISDWSSDVCSSDLQGSLANGFTCTFHNWRFNLDGSLKGVTDPETFRPETLCRNLDLSAVRCESWEGFIFVNLNPDAGPLLDQLGPLPDHARPYRLKAMRVVRSAHSLWDANWKVAVAGFTRSDSRRVGKGGSRTCRSRWCPHQ